MIETTLAQAAEARRQGDIQTAIALAQSAVEQEPTDPAALSFLGYAFADGHEYENARTTLRKAIDLSPKDAMLRANLGRLLIYSGSFEEARTVLMEAADLDPNDPAALYYFAQFARPDDATTLIGRLNKIDTNTIDAERQAMTAFALGKLHDISGEYDQAFEYFKKANTLSRPNYKHDLTVQFYQALKTVFANGVPKASEPGSERLVFIVGMPRSGSSIVEELLARNPDVVGLGERAEIPKTVGGIVRNHPNGYPGGLLKISQEHFRGIADICLKQYDQQANSARFIIDKNLRNFQHLGLIKILFPDAAIIHCRRDPIAVCLSSYFQFFQDEPYTFSFEDIAQRYAAYEDLMSYWSQIFPGKIITQTYEDLVADKEGAITKLCGEIGMEHTLAQTSSDRVANRDIQTTSAWQARQPIYKGALAHWKNYEKHLGPLFEALDKAGVSYDGMG